MLNKKIAIRTIKNNTHVSIVKISKGQNATVNELLLLLKLYETKLKKYSYRSKMPGYRKTIFARPKIMEDKIYTTKQKIVNTKNAIKLYCDFIVTL